MEWMDGWALRKGRTVHSYLGMSEIGDARNSELVKKRQKQVRIKNKYAPRKWTETTWLLSVAK